MNQPRILFRARVLFTNVSQSWLGGPASGGFFEVKTSTTSPLFSAVSSGTRRPLTLAPIVRCPISVCTAYAKSTGVAPDGRPMTRPFGVKT